LHANGIQKLILCGIRTEQCCETTARHASDEGCQVVSAEEITLRTETVLAGRFVTLV
jgi:nicotinamidase-related amidase